MNVRDYQNIISLEHPRHTKISESQLYSLPKTSPWYFACLVPTRTGGKTPGAPTKIELNNNKLRGTVWHRPLTFKGHCGADHSHITGPRPTATKAGHHYRPPRPGTITSHQGQVPSPATKARHHQQPPRPGSITSHQGQIPLQPIRPGTITSHQGQAPSPATKAGHHQQPPRPGAITSHQGRAPPPANKPYVACRSRFN